MNMRKTEASKKIIKKHHWNSGPQSQVSCVVLCFIQILIKVRVPASDLANVQMD